MSTGNRLCALGFADNDRHLCREHSAARHDGLARSAAVTISPSSRVPAGTRIGTHIITNRVLPRPRTVTQKLYASLENQLQKEQAHTDSDNSKEIRKMTEGVAVKLGRDNCKFAARHALKAPFSS